MPRRWWLGEGKEITPDTFLSKSSLGPHSNPERRASVNEGRTTIQRANSQERNTKTKSYPNPLKPKNKQEHDAGLHKRSRFPIEIKLTFFVHHIMVPVRHTTHRIRRPVKEEGEPGDILRRRKKETTQGNGTTQSTINTRGMTNNKGQVRRGPFLSWPPQEARERRSPLLRNRGCGDAGSVVIVGDSVNSPPRIHPCLLLLCETNEIPFSSTPKLAQWLGIASIVGTALRNKHCTTRKSMIWHRGDFICTRSDHQ
jgi:hypothetical protein